MQHLKTLSLWPQELQIKSQVTAAISNFSCAKLEVISLFMHWAECWTFKKKISEELAPEMNWLRRLSSRSKL